MNAFRPIETPRLRMRTFREADLAAFAAYRDEPAVARYQSWSCYTTDDARALLGEMEAKAFGLPGEWYQIALAKKSNDALVGDLALHVIDARRAEIGFTLAPAEQGKGYAREGVAALLRFLFEDFGCAHVSARTDARNTRSIRLLEAAGFRRLPGTRQAVFKGERVVEVDFEYPAALWRGRGQTGQR